MSEIFFLESIKYVNIESPRINYRRDKNEACSMQRREPQNMIRLGVLSQDQVMLREVCCKIEEQGYSCECSTGNKLSHMDSLDAVIVAIDGQDKLDILKDIHERSKRPGLISLTPADKIILKLSAVNAGAVQDISYPFSKSDLKRTIQNTLRISSEIRHRYYSFGDIVIDPAIRCLFYHSQQLVLTAGQLSLAIYILQNPGRYLHIEELMALFNSQATNKKINPKTVVNRLSRLKNKLSQIGINHFEVDGDQYIWRLLKN
jgi:DNA-binding response OmpR family regulator